MNIINWLQEYFSKEYKQENIQLKFDIEMLEQKISDYETGGKYKLPKDLTFGFDGYTGKRLLIYKKYGDKTRALHRKAYTLAQNEYFQRTLLVETKVSALKLGSLTSDFEKFTEILSWVQENIDYITDYEAYGVAEHFQYPHETILLGQGDCEDVAILTVVMCRIAGIHPTKIFMALGHVVTPSQTYGHAWPVFKDKKNWYVGEATAPREVPPSLWQFKQSYVADWGMCNDYFLNTGFKEETEPWQ